MLKIAFCDDEIQETRRLEALLEEYAADRGQDFAHTSYQSPVELMAEVEKGTRFDIILLDVMLPKMIGFDVCRTLREEGNNVPVIILTAREEEADKVLGLEIGADDYITKPFSMRELIARVGANIRRTAMNAAASASAAETAMPVTGGLSINTDSHQVFRDGTPLELTTREYELLTFLASHPNKVYSRIDLMEQVWNYGYVGDDQRTVDVTVRRLREKIETNPANPKYILTRRGVGYYFAV